jgi:hypothetical protein
MRAVWKKYAALQHYFQEASVNQNSIQEIQHNTVKPSFNESLGDWFSYSKLRFSLNEGYAKLHQKLSPPPPMLTVLYDFLKLVVLK